MTHVRGDGQACINMSVDPTNTVVLSHNTYPNPLPPSAPICLFISTLSAVLLPFLQWLLISHIHSSFFHVLRTIYYLFSCQFTSLCPACIQIASVTQAKGSQCVMSKTKTREQKVRAQRQLWCICLQMFLSSRHREGEGEKLLSQVM